MPLGLWDLVVVQLLSPVWLLATPWTAAYQASLSFTISQSLSKLMSIESIMSSYCLILCCPLLLLPSIFPSIRVFSNELAFMHQVAKILELQLQHQSVQSLSCVQLFVTPWTAACQASLSNQLPELAQTHVHRVSDAIQPSHPLSSSPPAFNLSQHQGLFQRVTSLIQVAKVLELQLQHQSSQWIFRTDFL